MPQINLADPFTPTAFGPHGQQSLEIRTMSIDFTNQIVTVDLAGQSGTEQFAFSDNYLIREFSSGTEVTVNSIAHLLVSGTHFQTWLAQNPNLEQDTLQALIDSGFFAGTIS